MKKIGLLLVALFPLLCFAQKVSRNYGAVDSSQHSMAFMQLHDRYDRIVAYTTEGEGQSKVIHYALIAEKQGVYYKGSIMCERKGDKPWPEPVVKIKQIDAKKAKVIVDKLDEAKFWKINTDSLNNQVHYNSNGSSVASSLSDGTNYRFELITGDKFTAVDAYAPDWFAEQLPEYTQRKQFIKVRDEFVKAFKAL